MKKNQIQKNSVSCEGCKTIIFWILIKLDSLSGLIISSRVLLIAQIQNLLLIRESKDCLYIIKTLDIKLGNIVNN